MARLLSHRPIRPVLLAVFALLVTGAPAQAAFPGENGKIAFLRLDFYGSHIYTMNPDGTQPTALTTSDPNPRSDPAWSPDGTKFAFRRDTNPEDTGGWEIYTMNSDGSGVTRVTNAPGVDDYQPTWSPDGTRIAFVENANTEEGAGQIYTVNADGSNPMNISNPSASESDGNPSWSPDGSKIAFGRTEPGSATNIYTMNADGSGQVRLVDDPAYDTEPAWSPDGTKIAFSSSRSPSGIWTMDADGTDQAFLTGGAIPDWSPDGTKIAFNRATWPPGDIFTINADGTGLTNLTQAQGGIMADWQPLQTYPRPRGATPINIRLVPAYEECTGGNDNASHGAPLAVASCNPANPSSGYLTVGTPDANGQADNSVGSVTLKTIRGDPSTPADEADVRIDTSITDVRRKEDLADYDGELATVLHVRLTDRLSGVVQTAQDFPFNVTVPCTVTADTTIGSSCALTTTADALTPGAVPEGKRSIWALDKVEVYDGGPDGLASTAAGNTLFETQGVFVP